MSIKISSCSYNNTIIGGINNISIGTCGSQGMTGSIGACGSIGIGSSIGIGGITGHQGLRGQAGYQITDWKEDIQNKYQNRFTIKTEYDVMTFAPTNIIIDNNTNEEYKFKPSNMSDIMNETDRYIQQLIIEIREGKINDIINASKD